MRRLVPDGTPTAMVITLGDRVFGPTLPPQLSAGCLALARIANTPLLGIEFTVGQSPAFVSATPMPDLRLGGEPLLDELARTLYHSRRRSN
jgi:hypothetical protein